MNMSATSSVEHGESPAWKKSKNTDVVPAEGDQSQASYAVNVCVYMIFRVKLTRLMHRDRKSRI